MYKKNEFFNTIKNMCSICANYYKMLSQQQPLDAFNLEDLPKESIYARSLGPFDDVLDDAHDYIEYFAQNGNESVPVPPESIIQNDMEE